MVKEKILPSNDVIEMENGVTLCHSVDEEMLHSASYLFPPIADCCELTVACDPAHFSASAIARAVEDCDSHLLNMNVTSQTTESGEMMIALRAGLRNAAVAARSLERYGYRVVEIHQGESDLFDSTFSARIANLLNIIEG